MPTLVHINFRMKGTLRKINFPNDRDLLIPPTPIRRDIKFRVATAIKENKYPTSGRNLLLCSPALNLSRDESIFSPPEKRKLRSTFAKIHTSKTIENANAIRFSEFEIL